MGSITPDKSWVPIRARQGHIMASCPQQASLHRSIFRERAIALLTASTIWQLSWVAMRRLMPASWSPSTFLGTAFYGCKASKRQRSLRLIWAKPVPLAALSIILVNWWDNSQPRSQVTPCMALASLLLQESLLTL